MRNTLLEGDLAQSVPAIKEWHQGDLIVSGAGELAHALLGLGLVDELWFWVSPWLRPAGPRIFDGDGPVRLLIGSTTFGSASCDWPTGRHPTRGTTPPAKSGSYNGSVR